MSPTHQTILAGNIFITTFCFSVREGNDPGNEDDIIFEDFARLRLKGAEVEEADA